jgi:peptide/nickel transport system substrate-binding protein
MLKNATDFDYYDPQRIYGPEDFAFFGATIMRSLVTYKASTDPTQATTLVPDMATDTGTSNADATTWSFTLRDGLSWQDGSPLKCEDIKYGVSRTFATDVINGGPTYAIRFLDIPKDDDGSSSYKGPYSAQGQDLFDQAVQCDGNTITFHLNKTVPDFNYTTTLGFGAVPNPIDHPGVDTQENYVGTDVWSDGPYQITSYSPEPDGSLILDRNPNWNRSSDDYRLAYPDRWEVDFGLDLNVIDQRITSSVGADSYAIDYGSMQPENLDGIFSDSHTATAAYAGRAFSEYDPYVRFYYINTKTFPDRDIRAAMLVALDREAIQTNSGGASIADFADGVLKPNIGPDYAATGLWETMFGEPIPASGDPDLARALIAESGHAPPKVTWSYLRSPTADANAATIKSSLEKAGFKVKLDGVDVHSCYSSAYPCFGINGEFGAAGWAADWPNASTVIPALFTGPDPYGGGYLTGGSNFSNVDDTSGIPDWTAQVEDAETTLDRADQAAKWQNLNKEAVEQAWVIPTFFNLSQTMTGTKIGGAYRWAPYSSWPYAQLYVTAD